MTFITRWTYQTRNLFLKKMPLNALNLLYCQFNITQRIIMKDVCNIIKGALEVFLSVLNLSIHDEARVQTNIILTDFDHWRLNVTTPFKVVKMFFCARHSVSLRLTSELSHFKYVNVLGRNAQNNERMDGRTHILRIKLDNNQ